MQLNFSWRKREYPIRKRTPLVEDNYTHNKQVKENGNGFVQQKRMQKNDVLDGVNSAGRIPFDMVDRTGFPEEFQECKVLQWCL